MSFSIKYFFFIALNLSIFGFVHADQANRAQPNILFCMADDASYEYMSAYGCKWVNTPNIERLAKNGLIFTRAYTPSPKCAPSRAIALTGRNPWQLEEAVNHWCYFPDKFKTYPEALRENGYEVAHTGKTWGPGIFKEGREMVGRSYNSKSLASKVTKGISKEDYAANFSDFLAERDKSKPFFFWFGCHEPHRPYEYGSGLKSGKKLNDITNVPAYWPDTPEVRTDMLDYAIEVEHFDRQLGLILDQLEKSGELDNTLIIVTSDNGMPFPRVKGHPYENSAHMPLVMMWKAGIKNPGRSCDELVSFIDFAPTVLDLAKLSSQNSGLQTTTGLSLGAIFTNTQKSPLREHLLMGRERNDIGRPNNEGYPVRVLLKGDLLYIHNFKPERWPCSNPETGFRDTDEGPTMTAVLASGQANLNWELCVGLRPQQEMYNIKKDPHCLVNLANNPEMAPKAEELRKALFVDLEAQGDLWMFGRGEEYEKMPYRKTRTETFYQDVISGKVSADRPSSYLIKIPEKK